MKLLRSLAKKKYREQHGLFLVEGEKMVQELLAGAGNADFPLREIYAIPAWLEEQRAHLDMHRIPIVEASEQDLREASSLVSPQPVLALVGMPARETDQVLPENECILAFDAVRDPGNLGTILRTADWFGIRHIVCSPDSVDVFNPKVIQSTMGAYARVKIHILELEALLHREEIRERAVFGTYLTGESIYETELGTNPVILFGNESHGLDPQLRKHLQGAISIPPFSRGGSGSESLNLASSVAVVCSELRRPA
jgi:TrmH family RNA methyltransferase